MRRLRSSFCFCFLILCVGYEFVNMNSSEFSFYLKMLNIRKKKKSWTKCAAPGFINLKKAIWTAYTIYDLIALWSQTSIPIVILGVHFLYFHGFSYFSVLGIITNFRRFGYHGQTSTKMVGSLETRYAQRTMKQNLHWSASGTVV